jgi:hypothetical protein
MKLLLSLALRWSLLFGSAASMPTFTKDVAPILFKSCTSCHRPGEIAPMSLLSYAEVRPWARAIKQKVLSREMPPWHADPHFSPVKFRNDRSLTQADFDAIVAWVDGGAPRGNDGDMPPVPGVGSGWKYGEPDYVIDMPIEFTLPAEGEVDEELKTTSRPSFRDRPSIADLDSR